LGVEVAATLERHLLTLKQNREYKRIFLKRKFMTSRGFACGRLTKKLHAAVNATSVERNSQFGNRKYMNVARGVFWEANVLHCGAAFGSEEIDKLLTIA